MQASMDMHNTGIQNQAALANMAAQQAQDAKFGQMLGGIGGLAMGGVGAHLGKKFLGGDAGMKVGANLGMGVGQFGGNLFG